MAITDLVCKGVYKSGPMSLEVQVSNIQLIYIKAPMSDSSCKINLENPKNLGAGKCKLSLEM